MKHKSWLRRLFAALMIALAVLLSVTLGGAVWDESNAVHIDAGSIEQSTLIIGSHLIHLSALTEAIYEIAMDSAGASGQSRVYYRSELADGTWFDITEASTLADITTAGTPVTNETINLLFLTHHTKSDKITYDLRTGLPVGLSQIKSPYELESMEELFPLKTQYDLINETQAESDAGEKKIERLDEFWETDVSTETTQLDQNLTALERYLSGLKGRDAPPDEIKAVEKVIAAVNAERWAKVMALLETALTEYSTELISSGGGEGEEEAEEEEEGAQTDTSLIGGVNDSLANVQSSRIKHEGNMLSQGTGVVAAARYRLSQKLISDAAANNTSACDEDVAQLVHLDNILNSIVSNKEGELAMLDGELLGAATGAYTGGIAAGENLEYSSATTDALKKGAASNNLGQLNTFRSELEFLIDAKCLRVSNEDAIAFVQERLTQAYGYERTVPEDAFFGGAKDSIDAHIDFLLRLLASLQKAGGGSELDKLQLEKARLQEQRLAALDHNDLALAQEIQDQIDELDGLMDSMMGDQINEINDLKEQIENTTDPELLDQLNAQLAELQDSQGGVGGLAAELLAEGKAAVRDGDLESLMEVIDALEEMLDLNHKVVFPVLQELHDALASNRDLNGDDSLNDAIDSIEDAILNSKAAYDAAMAKVKSEADLRAIADAYFDGLGDGGAAPDIEGRGVIFILALGKYHDVVQDNSILVLMRSEAGRQLDLQNPLVFRRVTDPLMEYLPVTAVAHYTGMRYVWQSARSQAVMASGATYYGFTAHSDNVVRSRDETRNERMTLPAKYLGEVHIPEDYTLDKLGVEAYYLKDAELGVLTGATPDEHAEALCALFLQ